MADEASKKPEGASPFANTTFSFTAPQGGVTGPFPSLSGFQQALADAAQGAAEEEGEEEVAPEVQVRIEYLKKLQQEREEFMDAFHEERKALVKKYALLTAPLLSKREALLKGAIDVKEEDGQVVEKPVEAAAGEGEEGETSLPKGIPNFWLRTLMSHRLIAGMVQEEDVGALKYLRDVECVDKEDGAGFSLHFHFAQPNPYFTNPVLSKAYEVPNLMDDGEAILQACAGTAIHWVSPKQNLCMEEKRMKPKGKSRGGVVVKQIKKESFFNWFEAVDIPEDPEDVEEEEYEELMGKLDYDYAVASILREEIVPEAIKWYLGEGEEDESEYADSVGESEEDDEDESVTESSDDDEPSPPQRRPRQPGRPRRGGR
ncbi:nucleosome chromatin assembly complex protein [Nannochloropsis gaditana]|uniref:Nucleosome chromatin assembly complex protein n=1 Tax=Nannochloropsis gaditana TaxID=72520 RepID=W7TQD0_9STRA|nr:nucleosome chromatin assembly complex protein [Nannochloropsis gaditana]